MTSVREYKKVEPLTTTKYVVLLLQNFYKFVYGMLQTEWLLTGTLTKGIDKIGRQPTYIVYVRLDC